LQFSAFLASPHTHTYRLENNFYNIHMALGQAESQCVNHSFQANSEFQR